MNPAVLKIVLVVLSAGVVIVKGLMAGSVDVNQIVDLLAGLGLGTALVKRPGDVKVEAEK